MVTVATTCLIVARTKGRFVLPQIRATAAKLETSYVHFVGFLSGFHFFPTLNNVAFSGPTKYRCEILGLFFL